MATPADGVDAAGVDAVKVCGASVGAAASSTAPPRLPATEFSYIGRPPESFEGRWAAIEEALATSFGTAPFSLVDVGSNHGYFSLSTALHFPQSHVVGVEGSVGIGNGAVGTQTRNAARLVATSAVQTHLDWIAKLSLSNCFVAPEVWDLDHIEGLAKAGVRFDAMLTLSVVHHIDGICQAAYTRRGLSQVDGSLTLLAAIFSLADVHIVELPDRPWMDHLHAKFGTAQAIIQAALARSGDGWQMRLIHRNDWFGLRELWLLTCRRDPGADCRGEAPLRAAFKLLLPGGDPGSIGQDLESFSGRSRLAEVLKVPAGTVPGDAAFVASVLAGRWANAYGSIVHVRGEFPRLECEYTASAEAAGPARSSGCRILAWDGGWWCLETPAGCFQLEAASESTLLWREQSGGWSTEWRRA